MGGTQYYLRAENQQTQVLAIWVALSPFDDEFMRKCEWKFSPENRVRAYNIFLDLFQELANNMTVLKT